MTENWPPGSSRSRLIIQELNNLGKDCPCPFCKGIDLDYCEGGTLFTNYVFVYCRKCNACGPYGTDMEQARKLWKQCKNGV